MPDHKIYIAALAAAVNRRESTVRSWCRHGKLPARLQPKRDSEGGWRYWTPRQVAGIKIWMRERKMAPGAGLKNYDPTPEQEDDLLEKLRGRRTPSGLV